MVRTACIDELIWPSFGLEALNAPSASTSLQQVADTKEVFESTFDKVIRVLGGLTGENEERAAILADAKTLQDQQRIL